MILCTTAFAVNPTFSSASILNRVLALLNTSFPQLKASNISANVAENIGNPTARPRSLAIGDQVIIGYDMSGTAVLGTADQFGVWVSPAQTATLQSGVSAGLYPVGSAIYALPPAGQLSIYEESFDGRSLLLAQESVMTRVDGTITNVLTSVTPTITSNVMAFNAGIIASYIDVSSMGSTALGAVNAGEIVTHVQVVTGSEAWDATGIDLAQIGKGPNVSFDSVLAGDVFALSDRVTQMGGGLNESILALNIASNTTEVTGRISNLVTGLSGSIGNIASTVIGAVNGGEVRN